MKHSRFQVIPGPTTDRIRNASRVTCTTCDLKGCLGKCHFASVKQPKSPKAA